MRHAAMFLAALGALVALAGHPAASEHDALRAEVARLVEETPLVGLAYALIEGGRVAEVATFGREAPEGAEMSRGVRFRFGSISKNVTSLLAADLAADGVLPLDAETAPLLPEGAFDNPWRDAAPVRLHHLLEHTSGLPGSTHRDYADAGDDLSPAEALRRSAPTRLRWRPGLHYSYANQGHTAAAAALAAAAGVPFDALVEARVLRPLGMRDATFRWGEGAPGTAPSFDVDGSQVRFWRMSVRPAGSLSGTIDDLARLVLWHAGDGASAPEVASAAMAERMRTPATSLPAQAGYDLSYGLGMFGFLEADRIFWGHWGRVDGFRAAFGVLPGEGRGFAIMTNTDDARAFGRARALVAAHAARGAPALAAVGAEQGGAEPVGAEQGGAAIDPTGWWRPFTEDMALRAWLVGLFGTVEIARAEDGLRVAPYLPLAEAQPLEPVGPGLFRAGEAPIATHVFAEGPDGALYMLGDQQMTYHRLTAVEAAMLRLGFPLAVLGLAVPPIAFMALLGRRAFVGAHAPSAAPWAWLAGASLGAAALLGLYIYWGMLAPLRIAGSLGAPGVRAVALSALSLVWPLLLVLGAASLLRRRGRIGAVTAAAAWVSAAGLAVAVAGLAAAGWLPLITWR